MPSFPKALVAVDGQPINVATLSAAVDLSIVCLKAGKGFSFLTLNLDHMVKRRASSVFRDAYARADLVSADGQPVVSLARRAGVMLERTTGADLVLPLCRAAADAGLPVYLFGTDEQALAKASALLMRDAPGLAIAGMSSPPMGFDPESDAGVDYAERIANSGAAICLIALPAMKQVQFMDRFHPTYPAIGYFGIGAALDFLAGSQVRAPAWVQTMGLEWLWRLMSSPRALLRRYWDCGLLYLKLRLSSTPRRDAS